MKRKLIYSLLVGIVLTIGITSVEASSTNEWCFGFNKRTNTISNYKNNSVKCPTNVVIPETIDGITVKHIAPRAFYNDGLNSVVIPETVTSIGEQAFAYNDITQINIPNTVTELGYAVFNNNPGKNVTFIYDRTDINNDGIAEIDRTKLIGLAIDTISYDSEDVNIPRGVKTIGTKAFYGETLSSINIPEGVKTIENKAFYGLYVTTLNLPSTLETADFSVDINQITPNGAIYHEWSKYDSASQDFIKYTFTPGQSEWLYSDTYFMPELYWADGNPTAYNKVKLEWYYTGSYDGTQIYVYNSKTKKYEWYGYTARENNITITKGIKPGQTYYFKVRTFVKTPDGKIYYSDFSDPIKVKPVLKAPTGVKAKKQRSGVAKITWNKVAGASGYTVYKYNSKTKKYFALKNTKKTSLTTKYGLKKGSKTYYKVKAYKYVNGKKVYSSYSKARYVRV